MSFTPQTHFPLELPALTMKTCWLHLSILTISLIGLLSFGGCGVPGPLGATVGGAQDIGYARRIIESGGIPDSSFIVAEGLFSEHDIPTPTGDCHDSLCLALGYGYTPMIDNGQEALLVHLGMTSTLSPQDFHRQHLQLAVVVDRSSSMADGSMESVKKALRSLATKLNQEDEVILVQFNDKAELMMGATRMGNPSQFLQNVDRLEADGTTNIEAGTSLGYEQLAKLPARTGASKRLMLLTDARPNVGATDAGSFEAITKKYADQGIGLSAFGVGVDFGQELIYHISQLRGGNFFYLGTQERIATVFDTEFDYLVTPIAYDLKITVKTPQSARLQQVYGLPTWQPGDVDAVLNIPTVFLSSNRGAIILRYESQMLETGLQFAPDASLGSGTMEYTTVSNVKKSQQVLLSNATGSALNTGRQYFTHDGTRLGAALTNTYLGLRLACALFAQGNKTEALAVLERAITTVRDENIILNNEGLTTEVTLMEKLRENIRAK